MPEPIFSYSAVATLPNVDGHKWLFNRSTCPYCGEQLEDLGSFHRNVKTVVPRHPDSGGGWICMECGRADALFDESRPSEEVAEGIYRYFPKQLTPLMGCLPNAFSCGRCGWWCAGEHGDDCNNPWCTPIVGILRRFDLSASDAPIEVLRAELPRYFDRIGTVHPNRMEDVVASILKGVYDAEVQQLGYTRDGGVDLIVLRGDRPIAVQVKRRIKRKTESVVAVREFLGASVLKQMRHLLYVSSAPNFSFDAKAAAERAVKIGAVESFELVSMRGLQDLLNNHRPPVWYSALQAVRREPEQIAKVIDPFQYVGNSEFPPSAPTDVA